MFFFKDQTYFICSKNVFYHRVFICVVICMLSKFNQHFF